LLSLQASISAKDQLGRQAIHLAAQAGCNTSLDYLITHHNMDVNVSTGKSKMTPLHLAAKVHLGHFTLSALFCEDPNKSSVSTTITMNILKKKTTTTTTTCTSKPTTGKSKMTLFNYQLRYSMLRIFYIIVQRKILVCTHWSKSITWRDSVSPQRGPISA